MRLSMSLGLLALLAACVPPGAGVRGERTLVYTPLALSVVRGAASGQRQQIEALLAINPDCSSQGYVSVRIVAPPADGQLSVEYGDAFSNYLPFSPNAACNKKRLPATLVYYTSLPGYAGPDEMTIEALFPNGNLRTIKFRIRVI